MLFDERDMRVFQNSDSRVYFKEILQSYYSQNYRATIVLLYSFVIYDLFMKLQTMEIEGDNKAKNMVEEINSLIADDEKYSIVENKIIEYFTDNHELYFKDFKEDINYLKDCRNKCAHLKVNDNTLYVPNDYQARMLICSMYDNILSVKAPFILDLFRHAETDVESYTNAVFYYPGIEIEKNIKNNIKKKYLSRMTYKSLCKSYKTFIKLNFISDDVECVNNASGLYVFIITMTEYIIEKGYSEIFKEENILEIFSRIDVENLKDDNTRFSMLVDIISTFPVIMEIIKMDNGLFTFIADKVLSDPRELNKYKYFYPSSEKTVTQWFKDMSSLQKPKYIDELFTVLKDEEDFDINDFIIIMIKGVPTFNGFNSADNFMSFFKSHISEFTKDTIDKVKDEYNKNKQCTNRSRHDDDIKEVEKILNGES
ncbi:hypothetical protein C7381_105129 [Ezakiella coagulans]|uniref:Uncharacterized protein n=2 Tax=Ezakiella coagulans TaxID=46507 RepID=A0A2U1E395_9FIRM|nr:hypothetical protein C7381_105129 [Ezakiella coagulans]